MQYYRHHSQKMQKFQNIKESKIQIKKKRIKKKRKYNENGGGVEGVERRQKKRVFKKRSI